MTEPALIWRTYDAERAGAVCRYDGCTSVPVVMRGPRSTLMRLPWHAYCAAHASLYGVIVRSGRLVGRAA